MAEKIVLYDDTTGGIKAVSQGAGGGVDTDKLDGYHASLSPNVNVIPVTSDKKYLPVGWVTTQGTITIYVDNVNGSDVTGDGSATNPFASVSKALSVLPVRLNHAVTIVLKASPNSYGSIFIRGFISEGGSLTIQGEFTQLDSGAVSSFSNSVDDPVYGSLVQVAKITDTTKNWTTNQFQYKLIRVYKGSTSYYRTICYNDENSIYCNQTFPVAIDNTWNYEILDWGTIVDRVEVAHNNSIINLSGLKINTPFTNVDVVRVSHTNIVTIYGCFLTFSVSANGAIVGVNDVYLRIYASVLDAVNNIANGALVINHGFSASKVDIAGSLFINNSIPPVYNAYGFSRLWIAQGTRFYKGNSNPARCIISHGGIVSFDHSFGKPLIDCGSISALYSSGAVFTEIERVSYGSNVVRVYDGWTFFPGHVSWGTGASILSSDQGGSIELGDSNLTGTKPYIDFHYGIGSPQGYNYRIQNNADKSLLFATPNEPIIYFVRGRIGTNNQSNPHSFITTNGSFATRVHTVNSNITLGIDHHIILVDASSGNKTITLPDASTCSGRQYIIKKIDSSSNSVVITPQAGQTIDGQTSISINTQYAIVRVVSDGSNWFII